MPACWGRGHEDTGVVGAEKVMPTRRIELASRTSLHDTGMVATRYWGRGVVVEV